MPLQQYAGHVLALCSPCGVICWPCDPYACPFAIVCQSCAGPVQSNDGPCAITCLPAYDRTWGSIVLHRASTPLHKASTRLHRAHETAAQGQHRAHRIDRQTDRQIVKGFRAQPPGQPVRMRIKRLIRPLDLGVEMLALNRLLAAGLGS